MKKIYPYILVGLIFSTITAFGQTVSSNKSAVVHSQFRNATTDPNAAEDANQARINVGYLDGLGRPEQSIGYRQSPQQNDLITQTQVYDNYGRPVKQVLPTVAPANGGFFQGNAQNLANSFYGDVNAFTETTMFDNSPLNRVREQFGAGSAWRPNNKMQVFHEAAGNAVRRYVMDASGNINTSGTYPNGILLKVRTVDEQGHVTVEVKDRLDRTIEKWVQDESGFMITHYVYDNFRRLRAIIQPEGYRVDSNNTGFTYGVEKYKNFIFAYEYDNENRIKRKHIPVGGWTSFVYDKADRPVLEQSALQATVNLWNFTKYDVFGRVVVVGELTINNKDRQMLQNEFDGIAVPYDVLSGNSYTNQSFPVNIVALDIRQTNYYDTYDWVSDSLNYDSNGAYNSTAHYANSLGLMTGNSVRSNELTGQYFTTVMHYDNKGRTIQTYLTHHKGGGNLNANPVRTDYGYNFAGEVINLKKTSNVDGEPPRVKIKNHSYDYTGRKIACDLNIGNINERLVNYEFDGIGRLNRKIFLPNGNFTYDGAKDYIFRPVTDGNVTQSNTQDVARKAIILEPVSEIDAVTLTSYSAQIHPNGGVPITGLQKVNYKHHIRGGLLGINLDGNNNPDLVPSEADLFAYKLDYETAGFYDGNIGKETWRSAKNTGTNRSYEYSYDPAKRLKSATYSGGMFTNENYNVENINYDKNGNIETFWRKGVTAQNGTTPTGFDYVDKMQYFYSGNRLDGVMDAVNNNLNVSDFRDNGSSSDYTYWEDGSLQSDANRNISSIKWDTFLKKQTEINYVNGDWIRHFYDGGGKRFKTTDSEGTVWEFVDELIYKNGTLYQISDDEGRILYENDTYFYEFNYKDHLGNIRVSFKAVGKQLIETQENSYYPFGLSHNGTDFTLGANTDNFQYNGKEKINSFGLNYSDYGFRTYDLLINRFISVDPLAESFAHNGVYNYAENAPVMNVDLDGLEKLKSISPDGKTPEYGNGLDRSLKQNVNPIGFKSSATQSLTGRLLDWFGIKTAKIYGSGNGRDDLGAAYDTKSSSVFDLGREKEFSTFLSALSVSGGGANTPGKLNLREFMNATDALKAISDVYDNKEFINVESTGLLFNPDYKLPSGTFFIEDYNNANGAKWNMVGVQKDGKVKMDNKVYFAFYENSGDGKKAVSGTMTFQQLIDLAKSNSKEK